MEMDLPHIFRTITSVFEADPLIDEFGIVLSLEDGPDGDKVFLVHSEHKLGLLYSAVKPLFQYTLSKFYEIIKTLKEVRDAHGIETKEVRDAYGIETIACSHDVQSIIQSTSSSVAAVSSSSSSSSLSLLSSSSGPTRDGGGSIRGLRQQLLSYSRVILLIRGDFPMAFSIRKGASVK